MSGGSQGPGQTSLWWCRNVIVIWTRAQCRATVADLSTLCIWLPFTSCFYLGHAIRRQFRCTPVIIIKFLSECIYVIECHAIACACHGAEEGWCMGKSEQLTSVYPSASLHHYSAEGFQLLQRATCKIYDNERDLCCHFRRVPFVLEEIQDYCME